MPAAFHKLLENTLAMDIPGFNPFQKRGFPTLFQGGVKPNRPLAFCAVARFVPVPLGQTLPGHDAFPWKVYPLKKLHIITINMQGMLQSKSARKQLRRQGLAELGWTDLKDR